MGWPPAVVIVVRHGARLDAADKQWHLTSPTPYDPPLTYGGWNQSKALGARIANILRTRETDDEIPITAGEVDHDGAKTRKRRHRVIIHSSPFLRCVQTSVAISAGLAQNPGHTAPRPSSKASLRSSPRMRSMTLSDSPKLDPIPEPVNGRTHRDGSKQSENIKKATIRVDAFLGEWLSPDYFEHITHPPSSIMMVAGAKADLLRREDYSSLQIYTNPTPVNQGFPGGWGSPVVLPQKKEEKEEGLSSLSSLAQALPRRDRTNSLSSMGNNSTRPRPRSPNPIHAPLTPPAEHGVYQPPIPTYAISNANPIPPGYVAHARDACVDVDYQWDSMREPQMWGDGGEYDEEWSSMHKRFRNGLKQMVDWYSTSEDPGKLATKTPTSPRSPLHGPIDCSAEEDEDTDLVLVLVTHGAGCNALIGALTSQPVLLDVGMASLTMAVRKPTPISTPASSPTHSRNNSRSIAISDQYDVKLVANTEHLRSSAASTPSSSRTPSVSSIAKFREPSRNDGAFDRPARSFTASGNFGSIRRTASIATPGAGAHNRNYAPIRQSSIGLWSPAPAQAEEPEEPAPEDDMILNFGNENEGTVDSPTDLEGSKNEAAVPDQDQKEKDEHDDVAPLGGLWGAPRPPGQAEQIRDTGNKRRWTVNERALVG